MDQDRERPRTEPPPRGLLDEGVPALRARLATSWDAFLAAAEGIDPDAPSRRRGWRGRDVLAHLGTWPDHDPLDQLVDSARTGRTGPREQATESSEVRRRYAERPPDELLAALVRARDATLTWLDSPEAGTLGMQPAATIVGPLPLLTGIQGLCFELATYLMDLERCGAPDADPAALRLGLAAICDATAGVAHRVGSFTSVTVQTPDGGWQMSISEHGWTTRRRPPEPVAGTGVSGRTRDLLDVAAGRGNLPVLYASGRIRVVDLPGFLELAPLIDHMPGIPNRAALKAAAVRLAAVNDMLRRRRPSRRTSPPGP